MQRLAVWRNPVHFLAFGFGSGLAPKAPGTFGTLAAIPLYLLMTLLPLSGYLVVLVLAAGLGIYLCDRTAKDLGVHDHPGIVWDEFVLQQSTTASLIRYIGTKPGKACQRRIILLQRPALQPHPAHSACSRVKRNFDIEGDATGSRGFQLNERIQLRRTSIKKGLSRTAQRILRCTAGQSAKSLIDPQEFSFRRNDHHCIRGQRQCSIKRIRLGMQQCKLSLLPHPRCRMKNSIPFMDARNPLGRLPSITP